MAAKKKTTTKKTTKKVVKPVVEEVKLPEADATTTPGEKEEEIVVAPQVVEESTPEVMGTVGSSIVTKPRGRIKFEAQVAPYPRYLLPKDIRDYLIRKGLTTNVWRKDKEWLERHNVDMEMVEKLKKFLSERE